MQRKYREKQKIILANKEEKMWELAGQVKALEAEKVRSHRKSAGCSVINTYGPHGQLDLKRRT